jgi:hypothetical protein
VLPEGLGFVEPTKKAVYASAAACILNSRMLTHSAYASTVRGGEAKLKEPEFNNLLVCILHCAQWTLEDTCLLAMEIEADLRADLKLKKCAEKWPHYACCCIIAIDSAFQTVGYQSNTGVTHAVFHVSQLTCARWHCSKDPDFVFQKEVVRPGDKKSRKCIQSVPFSTLGCCMSSYQSEYKDSGNMDPWGTACCLSATTRGA